MGARPRSADCARLPHGRGRHPRAPQRLGDVLDPAHRYPCQTHLDQRLLDRALAPPVALDNRRLEGLRPKLRDLQPYLAGLGLQLALIVARARVPTRLAALIPLRIAQPICLGIEQGVQRFLHAPSHDPVEVALDPLVVNRDDIVQRTRCSLGHGGSFSLTWLRLATSSSARFGAVSPNCAKDSVRHLVSCFFGRIAPSDAATESCFSIRGNRENEFASFQGPRHGNLAISSQQSRRKTTLAQWVRNSSRATNKDAMHGPALPDPLDPPPATRESEGKSVS